MQAFETLYTQYYDKVYCFMFRLCADATVAEDLTQETFLQAFTSFHKFRGECQMFTWLAAIGKHVYFKYLKKNKLQLQSSNLDLVAQTYCFDGAVNPEVIYQKKDVEQAVRRVLEGIAPKYRDVVLLRIYAELSFAEIAVVLKISENSAKVIYFRAKKMLLEVLKDEFEL